MNNKRNKRVSAADDPYRLYHSASLTPVKGKDSMYYVVYIIRHRSGAFYIGSHQSENRHPILSTYFTSSNVVKMILEVDGTDSFVVEKVLYFKNRDAANLVEAMLIRNNKPSTNRAILNKAYQMPKSNTVIEEWSPMKYNGATVRINPKHILLVEDTNVSTDIWYPVKYKKQTIEQRMRHDPSEDFNRVPQSTGIAYRVRADGSRVPVGTTVREERPVNS